MKDGIQNLIYSLGGEGCYTLCLLDVAEEYLGHSVNILDVVNLAIYKGYIYYDWKNWKNPQNFYVEKPGMLLKLATGVDWMVLNEDAGRLPNGQNQYIIRRYERKNTTKTYSHFSRDTFQPYLNNGTEKYGTEVSTRLCVPSVPSPCAPALLALEGTK